MAIQYLGLGNFVRGFPGHTSLSGEPKFPPFAAVHPDLWCRSGIHVPRKSPSRNLEFVGCAGLGL